MNIGSQCHLYDANQYLQRDMLIIPCVNKKNYVIWGQARWANMMSPWGKLTALACHTTKKVNKTEYLTCLSVNIGANHRHLSIIDCLNFVMCLLLALLALGFFSFFFCCGHLSTNEANRAGGTCH